MFISHVTDEEESGSGGRGDSEHSGDHNHEYQTASQLFELLSRNNSPEANEDESLTARDLIILYKNIEIGTKLISDANELKRKPPNQYVETIVYEDFDSDSDLSEICSSEDIHNVVMINKEQIDLLNHPSSIENTLCHKFGDLEIRSSDLTVGYDRKLIFKDQYIKTQLKSLNIMSNEKESDKSILPVSLLDYICYKRLEDNYNFYMDNIIRYVNHTIDQLKRISNGDYLTEKAKEKWREVEKDAKIEPCDENDCKVLANSTSIPLYIERKVTGNLSKWDDLVHSEVDIRSLSKILEKKIVVEVPKTLCGSFKLFSESYNDNLIIRCKKGKSSTTLDAASDNSRLDVVLQLDRSKSGHVISRIGSIMILQKKSENTTDILPLPFKDDERRIIVKDNNKNKNVKITELCNDHYCDPKKENKKIDKKIERNINSIWPQNKCPEKKEVEIVSNVPTDSGYQGSNFEKCCKRYKDDLEASFSLTVPEELRIAIQRLNMTPSLPEETTEDITFINYPNTKKKSSIRNRIKSPYENKSHLVEEKKRRRLLEIRQRREKKKIALSENCKVNKHKYGKGSSSPQMVNSVTKLSITNKSFYNSIYGESINMEQKQSKVKIRNEKKDSKVSSTMDSESSAPDQNLINQKYINKTYYLDNADTEMMYLNTQKPEKCDAVSESTSNEISNDINTNLKIFTRLITPSVIALNVPDITAGTETLQEFKTLIHNLEQQEIQANKSRCSEQMKSIDSVHHIDAPNKDHTTTDEDEPKKLNTPMEFRKSIDKIYELINKLGKAEGTETKLCKSKFTAVTERVTRNCFDENSTIPCSDSGTSLKHHPISSNLSYSSFGKANGTEEPLKIKKVNTKKPAITPPSNVVPKVIISAKPSTYKSDGEALKKDHRKASPKCNTENPLKAISQILHEFDNVQKTRNRIIVEKVSRKPELSFAEEKLESRQPVKKSLKPDSHIDMHPTRSVKGSAPKERKFTKSPNVGKQANPVERPTNKPIRKKVVDIVDEIKEARGEAIRGPSKLNARLNSLAQPKKNYIKAQIEDFQARYGKSFVTDRLQKLSASQSSSRPPSPKRKPKRGELDMGLPILKQAPLSPPPVSEKSHKKSYNNSREVTLPVNDQSLKQFSVDASDNLKKKVLLLERPSQTSDSNELLNGGQKLKVPLYPNDIDMSSCSSVTEESTSIANKIHRMVDCMILAPTTLDELHPIENISKYKNRSIDDILLKNNCSHQMNMDISDGVLSNNCSNDKGIDKDFYCNFSPTISNNHLSHLKRQDIIGDTIPEENDEQTIAIKTPNSTGKLKTLEHALYRRISIEAFQKRLRLKNFTLIPNKSSPQVSLLESGDTNSVVVQSALSQDHTINKEAIFKTLPKLTGLDWGFTKFPMQIATVAYSFPQFQKTRHDPNLKPNSLVKTENKKHVSIENLKSDKKDVRSDKTSQCFKNNLIGKISEQAVQVEAQEVITISSVIKICQSVMKERDEDRRNGQKKIPVSENNGTVNINTNSANCIHCRSEQSHTEKLNVIKAVHVEPPIINIKDDLSANKYPEKKSSGHIDYTASLDVLVGLLNEIHKITTCQTQMANGKVEHETEKQREELESILKSTAGLEDGQNQVQSVISITTLDKLRQLESSPSIYSFCLSNNDENEQMDSNTINLEPLYADKGISVIMPERDIEFVNKCTDVPSIIFPATRNHAITISNSFIGVLSEPSSQSVFTFDENNICHDSQLTTLKNIIDLPNNFENGQTNALIIQRIVDNERTAVQPEAIKGEEIIIFKKKKQPNNENKNIGVFKNGHNKTYAIESNVDPVMKMKRDILVTVYSVLVLTVFAALSFPEILYRS